MSFLAFNRQTRRAGLPKRVYASLDRIDPDVRLDGKRFTATFEAVDADWFDGLINSENSKIDFLRWDKNISVVEIDSHRHPFPLEWLPLIPDDRPYWIEVNFETGFGNVVSHFMNLFQGDPFRRPALLGSVSPGTAKALDEHMSTDAIPDADQQAIEAALKAGAGPAGMVFDVGQGNCNAVVDAARRPTLYFDFGGGVMRNSVTYPPNLTDLCFTQSPPIVLSHWDWDHWSSALRTPAALINPQAQAATWIVPRQRLGAVHRTLLAGLHKVLVWPAGLTQAAGGDVTVYKCNGSGRNHSGLAAVFKPDWSNDDGILLTGDCDYTHLPSSIGLAKAYDAVVVPHHGGPMHGAGTPAPSSAAYKRLCYSYGLGNSYKHPVSATLKNHRSAGWKGGDRLDTATRSTFSHWTAGHILLEDPAVATAVPCAPPPCLTNCDLPAIQS